MNVARLLATKGMTVVTIRPEQTIREAIDLLSRYNIGALVVVDQTTKPVGIISERDIVRESARNEKLFTDPVHTIMTKNVITAMPQDDASSQEAHTGHDAGGDARRIDAGSQPYGKDREDRRTDADEDDRSESSRFVAEFPLRADQTAGNYG